MPGTLVRIKDGLSHRTSTGILAGDSLYVASKDELRSFGDKFDLVPLTSGFVSKQTIANLTDWCEQGVLKAKDVLACEQAGKKRKTLIATCETLLSAGDV